MTFPIYGKIKNAPLPQLGLLLLLGLLLKDDLVSWDYDIPNMMGKIWNSCSKPPIRLCKVAIFRASSIYLFSFKGGLPDKSATIPLHKKIRGGRFRRVSICENPLGPIQSQSLNPELKPQRLRWKDWLPFSNPSLVNPPYSHLPFLDTPSPSLLFHASWWLNFNRGRCLPWNNDPGNLWDPCKLHQASASMGIDGHRWAAEVASWLRLTAQQSPVTVLNTANCGISSTITGYYWLLLVITGYYWLLLITTIHWLLLSATAVSRCL